jgi:hypothetical protein
MQITTIGLDLAKNVSQVHGINAQGDIIVRRRLRRTQVHEFLAFWRHDFRRLIWLYSSRATPP